ncbi:MAG: nucleoside deaminase [Rhodothermales bacterium]|nr:nucleoside deaminase [Rhodothermales bacterium]
MTYSDKNGISEHIQTVIDLAANNCQDNGGPFAALVVRDGKIIAEGLNRVTANGDPTAHAEIMAIRSACKVLGSFQLDGCELFSSCEPCPMCLGAIYWARPARVYFAAWHHQAALVGFDDEHIYNEINLAPELRTIPMHHVKSKRSNEPFERWKNMSDKTEY